MATGPLNEKTIEDAVADFCDPETGRGALQLKQIRDIRVDDDQVTLTLELTTWASPLWDDVRSNLETMIRSRLPSIGKLTVEVTTHERAPQPRGEIGLMAKSVIAVGSGKGGVGKSTIAASLAAGLKRAGATVGLMDADVYGPSIPHLMGVQQRPEVVNDKIQPVIANGMPLMSMGFLIPPDEAVVWRGPMLHGAITQFLRDTHWGALDYLIIDMPPGTGDIALTLSQLIPLTGSVVVCTPQEVALLDAVKAIAMFRKVNIPILGMVENMSGFLCPDCGKKYDIFGSGGARKRAEQLQVPFLGEVPITMQIRELGDAGQVDASYEDEKMAACFEGIVRELVGQLAGTAAANPVMPQLPVLGG